MLFIAIAAICYAVGIVFITASSRHINTNLSAGLVNLIGAIVPLAVAAPLVIKKSASFNKFGLAMAMAGGMFIAIFAMALTKSYSLNKVAIVAPLVFGGAILISTVLSFIFLKEKVSVLQTIGLIVLTLGLAIITYARATGK